MPPAPSPTSPRLAVGVMAELFLLGLIWGASFFAIAIALREMGPFAAVLHRVTWAAAILWVVVALRRLPVPRDPSVWAAFFVMGLLNNAIPFSLMAWGQLHIETGLVSIFNASTAVFGALVAALLLRDERLTGRRALGVGLGFAGVVAMIGAEALNGLDLRSMAQGAVALGALSYAFASVWAKTRLRGHPPEVAAAGMLTASTVLVLPVALAVEGPPPIALSAAGWSAVAWYAGLGTAAAYLLYYRILKRAGAADLMLVTLIIPPIAIGLGAAFLGERIGAEAALGFGLLALGLAVIDGRLAARLRWTRGRPAA